MKTPHALSIAEPTHDVVLVYVMRGVFQAPRGGIASSRERLYAKKGARDELFTQHRAVYDAIVAGDARAARTAVSNHLEFVKAQLH